MNQIEFTWVRDDDWIGQLGVKATSDEFSGASSAWFNREDVEGFARAVELYPLTGDPPASLAGGYEGHPMLSVSVAQCDPRGIILVTVHLANDDMRTDLTSHAQVATLRLHTEYAALADFAPRLAAMVQRGGGSAVLRCL